MDGISSAHLQGVDQAAARIGQRTYSVEICRPDGSVLRYSRTGGNTIDHSTEAMDKGGLGAVVRIKANDVGVAA